MENYKKYFEVNKQTWNTKVPVHAASAFYDLEHFRSGISSLNSYELEALGDVSGKSMLHLQCHFGQDTLSWSRLGAQCTGVDISEEGVAMARQLNSELGLDADFVCCNVLDTSEWVTKTFDLVYTSYGVICWLPELQPWAQMIAERLVPGGTFYMVEFHPIAWMFDYSSGKAEMKYPYHHATMSYEEYQGTYADQTSTMISKEYVWNHGMGELICALTEAGLEVGYLKEHDASPYAIFPNLEKNAEGMFELQEKYYPLLFEIKATKPK